MSSLRLAWSPVVSSVIALAAPACKTSSRPDVEHNRAESPETGATPGSSSAAPPATASPAAAPAGSTFPPLDLAIDWPAPVTSHQLSPTSVVTGPDGAAVGIGLVLDGMPQTIEAYKQQSLKDSDILPHENEKIERLPDGWSATYESVDKYWAHVQRKIRGKSYFCEGATDSPTARAAMVRFCKALR
jgi:hypothetical protein